jgi:hypothetical protein
MGNRKNSDLSILEIEAAKYNILRAVLTAAGQGCLFDSMRAKIWMAGRHPVFRVEGTAPEPCHIII